MLLFLVGGERAGDAPAHVVHRGFVALGVLFDQHFARDFLFRERKVDGRLGGSREG